METGMALTEINKGYTLVMVEVYFGDIFVGVIRLLRTNNLSPSSPKRFYLKK